MVSFEALKKRMHGFEMPNTITSFDGLKPSYLLIKSGFAVLLLRSFLLKDLFKTVVVGAVETVEKIINSFGFAVFRSMTPVENLWKNYLLFHSPDDGWIFFHMGM